MLQVRRKINEINHREAVNHLFTFHYYLFTPKIVVVNSEKFKANS